MNKKRVIKAILIAALSVFVSLAVAALLSPALIGNLLLCHAFRGAACVFAQSAAGQHPSGSSLSLMSFECTFSPWDRQAEFCDTYGLLLIEKGEVEQAKAPLQKVCGTDKVRGKGCFHLAEIYTKQGNVEQALRYNELACHNGDMRGCEANDARRKEQAWIELATKARRSLQAESSENAPVRDLEQAKQILLSACEQKNEIACFEYANILAKRSLYLYGAKPWYQRACDLGHHRSCFEAAAAEERLPSGDKPADNALAWYRKGCADDCPGCCQYLVTGLWRSDRRDEAQEIFNERCTGAKQGNECAYLSRFISDHTLHPSWK